MRAVLVVLAMLWTGAAVAQISPGGGSTTSALPSVPSTTPYCGTGAAGAAAGCGSSLVLPNGTTATTQGAADNSQNVATTAYVDPAFRNLFCTGADGTVTISSGTTTLTRDMCYANLTISGTGKISTAGYRIFVNGTLDISGAGAQAIFSSVTAGGNASGATAGNTTVGLSGFTVPGAYHGGDGTGGTGTTGVGGNGNANGSSGNSALQGGNGGSGGVGGAGTSAAGTPGAINTYFTNVSFVAPSLTFPPPPQYFGVSNPIISAAGASGGSAGGGDGTNTGGGGGGGGNAPAAIVIYARTIARGSNITAGIIQSKGSNGGNGGNSSAGNTGGGGGAGGTGGGWVYVVYQTLTGSTITGAIDVSGGNGGNGGTGQGTGKGGTGGTGGASGNVQIVGIGGTYSVSTFNQAGSAATVATTTAGTTGGAAATLQVNL